MGRLRSKAGIAPTSSFLSRLNAYALMAGAAGVGALAAAPAADAEVIYTPVHVVLSGSRASYDLDLNGDGISDFGLGLINSTLGGSLQGFVDHISNGFETHPGVNWPLALKSRAPIGPGQRFYGCIGSCGYTILAEVDSRSSSGQWVNVSNRYLGLRFVVGKDLYYGWARMTVKVSREKREVEAAVTGYAYESTPNQGIHAGQTSGTFDEPCYDATGLAMPPASFLDSDQPLPTLGILALGALGLPLQ